VLRTVAATLQTHLRRSDLLGRIGGEEFSVFLPDTDLDGARQVAENLRLAVQACQLEVDGSPLSITASIGVAVRTRSTQTLQALQQQADEAMYEAKKAGRNRVSTLDTSQD